MARLKILIAEDEKALQMIYDKGFSDKNFEKRFVNNGADALRIFKSWSPDILILDIMMPVMMGFKVLEEIRKIEPVAKTNCGDDDKKSAVVIMSSSLKEKNDINTCIKMGINGYLVKPLNLPELHEQVMNYYLKVYPGK